jgi:hypothetical protein
MCANPWSVLRLLHLSPAYNKQYDVVPEAVYAPLCLPFCLIYSHRFSSAVGGPIHIEGAWNEGMRQQEFAGKPASAEDPWELGHLLVRRGY